jgi:hypothetical protein
MSFARFRDVLATSADVSDPRLLMGTERGVEVRYAPFDYVNPAAKVVILGITPGRSQANLAIASARAALSKGLTDEETLRIAKGHASFGGKMRGPLIRVLDSAGIAGALGIETCATLWSKDIGLVQFASALRYPVFVGDADYNGTPKMGARPLLRELLVSETARELASLPDAVVVPLGPKVSYACDLLVKAGLLDRERVIDGVPHPSGSNNENVNYFVSAQPGGVVSNRRKAFTLDERRASVDAAVAAWKERMAS